MAPQNHVTVEERRRGERTIWRRALVASVVLHLMVLLFWKTDPFAAVSPFAAAGPRSGDDRAARGGMQALRIQAPRSGPIVPPRVPLPTISLEDPIDFEPEVELDASSLLGEGPGDLTGPGLPNGTGLGAGGTGDSGRSGADLVPPSPRGMIMPPANRSLRGRQVEVWVFVDEAGRVVADSTRLRPPTPDRDFNRRLIEEAAEWVFDPARQHGRPVAAWFPYTISM